MDKFKYLIVLLTTLSVVNGELKIIDIKVPSSVESDESDGGQKDLILDCEYEVQNEEGLVVKWFFNEYEQVYQWIPPKAKPQALGNLKDRLDLDYKVSNDSNTMYRALRIKDVTTNLSGLYTCKVSSNDYDRTATRRMIIYDKAKEFDIQKDEDSDSVNCTASGLYPEPKMNLFILGLNATNDDNDGDEDDIDEVELTEDNFYNIGSKLDFEQYRITEPVTFICELWIPDTDYKQQRILEYSPGGIPSSTETQIESDFEFPTNATEQDNSSPTQHCSSIIMSLVLGIFFQRLF